MQGRSQSSVANDIALALSWWREAGVDYDFSDEALEWLAKDEPAPSVNEPQRRLMPIHVPPSLAEAPPVVIGGDSTDWPQDLAAFQAWWMSEPTLDQGSTSGRVPPKGGTGARLMILVEQPEAEDREELLSGPHGNLVSGMLRAMGIDASEAYFASVLPRNTPVPDWQGLATSGLGAVLRHHLRLAAPQRVIALGGNIPPLLGHDPTQSAQNLHIFNHDGLTVPVLLDRGPDALMRARAKAAFWQRWLEWTGT